MNVKVSYLVASSIEELQEKIDKELEALQLNTKIRVVEVRTSQITTGYLVQIVYMVIETPPMQILNEGEKVYVPEN